ncbi:hypothetical protein C427_2869 [Paraglaciecola psychrophila 170]|uniref:Uncharacterized protein n=1 Tax=Paraglaciecola psychrophila 170 TaxID=1129794 RepID=K7A1U8_9ALTE|nr:hypothetical protein C427_2869 [Paraglaciecola psychrophila 170]GAC36332.1 hypothetical protein GPSY_0694 [Paraglaciecola psychrophila 170]
MEGDPFNQHFKYLHKTQPWIQLRSALIIDAARSMMENKSADRILQQHCKIPE